MSYAPFAGNPILQGKFMMFSKEIIKQIIENKYILYDKKYPNAGYWVTQNKISCVDDVSISSVLNILNKDKKYNDYLSCVMNLQICINNITYDDVKQYIETYSKYDNVLHSIVFREMEDISELNDVNVENILFRYKDIDNDLKNDKDFKLIDSVTKYDLEYYNHIYQYKDCNIPIIFTQPPEFKTKHNKITPFITLYPDGKVYKEYFTKLN